MVRGHQGCTLIELKTRMQAAHGSEWRQTENTVARLYRLGLLQNRSTAKHIPVICTPGCKTIPAHTTPNQRAVLATQAATEKRLKAQAARAAHKALTAEIKKIEPRTNTNLHCTGLGKLCAPRITNAASMVDHVTRLLLTLADGERLDAEQIADRLGMPAEVTAVRTTLSRMDYHGKVRSRYNADRSHLLYSIDPSTAALLRKKQATESAAAASQPAHNRNGQHLATAQTNTQSDHDDDNRIKPGQYNPAALQCDRADGKAFLAYPSLRNGQRVPYDGIRGMCTGAAGPIAHTPSRLKQ